MPTPKRLVDWLDERLGALTAIKKPKVRCTNGYYGERPTHSRQDALRRELNEVLAAIYYDVNAACLLRTAYLPFPESADEDFYTKTIIHQESERQRYEHLMDGLAGFPKSQTVASFISHMGWKMFGIFAHSEAFRSAADEFDIGKWKLLMVQIAQNAFSLEMFARLRCLEWRGLFLKHTIAAPKSLLQALGPESRLPVTHHHHFVLSSNGKWHEPTSADHLQEHTEHSIVNSRAWPDASVKVRDPSIRRRLNGNCDVCGYETRCDCVLRSLAGSLIELVPSSVRGTGVRALTNFQAGDILDQYVGELCPPSFPGDAIYGLVLESKEAQGMSKTRAVLSPKRYGNWLRFLEHSCDASVRFHCRTVGDRIILTAEANRDIGFGEEITVDYGHAYWRDKNCCCGEEKCYSNPMSQERVK